MYLPGTLASRLTLLALILFSLSFFVVPYGLQEILVFSGMAAILGAGLFLFKQTKASGELDTDDYSPFMVLSSLIIVVSPYLVPAGLAFLVSLVGGGGGFAATYQFDTYVDAGAVGWAEMLLVLAMLWLLVGVPNQAFMARVDNDGTGDAQRVMLGVITTASCALTGIYLLLMYFGGGPLHKLSPGALTAGIVVTVVLVRPLYRSLAKLIWRRGLVNVISYEAVQQYWGTAAIEVRQAFDRSAESETTREFWRRVVAGVLIYKGLRQYWESSATEVRKALD